MRYSWRVDQWSLGCYNVLVFSAEQRDSVTVSPVALVVVNGHLKLLWIRQFNRLTLVRVEILYIPVVNCS